MNRDGDGARCRLFFTVYLAAVLGGCAPDKPSRIHDQVNFKNLVVSGDLNLVRNIGDFENQFEVLGRAAFRAKVNERVITPDRSYTSFNEDPIDFGATKSSQNKKEEKMSSVSDGGAQSLVLGLPMSLLGQSIIFGSVITQVSDSTDQVLGRLKLSSVPPFLSRLVLRKAGNGSQTVSVLSCDVDCTESNLNSSDTLLEIPVLGTDSERQLIYLNLASLGTKLDLVAKRKDDSRFSRFKSKTSDVTRFDFSNGTLVFDVRARLTKMGGSFSSEIDTGMLAFDAFEETEFVNRWYLATADRIFNSSFVSRKGTAGVGFFMSGRGKDAFLQRWDLDNLKYADGIKYYIKNVPSEHQKAFAAAFDEWNSALLPVLNKKVFSYEFIGESDPRNELIIAGDIRYNVLEWDLVNQASYGGHGPLLAHPSTGEIFNANVLIQGPSIINMYSKWFNVSQEVNRLLALGKDKAADLELLEGQRALRSSIQLDQDVSVQLTLDDRVHVRISSKDPALDALDSTLDFEPIPSEPGLSYETYMAGYFRSMVSHELGHNLGLRHNFRGNLGALVGSPVHGGVSRSVMEYLGREFRYLDQIGPYDLMAIAYAYKGDLPHHTDWYCTDQDVAKLDDPSKSAECSAHDATDDPFSYFESRLERSSDLLVGKDRSNASDWDVSDLLPQFKVALEGIGAYAVSAEQTAGSWSNFFGKPGRPNRVAEVPSYTLMRIRRILCDPRIDAEANSKLTLEAQEKTKEKISSLREKVAPLLKGVYSPEELKCEAAGAI